MEPEVIKHLCGHICGHMVQGHMRRNGKKRNTRQNILSGRHKVMAPVSGIAGMVCTFVRLTMYYGLWNIDYVLFIMPIIVYIVCSISYAVSKSMNEGYPG